MFNFPFVLFGVDVIFNRGFISINLKNTYKSEIALAFKTKMDPVKICGLDSKFLLRSPKNLL